MFEILDNVELPTVVAQTINLEQFYNQAADNKYKYHYQRLVERAKSRWLSGYYEKHHVIPKCLAGLDDVNNLIRLTAEEHYVAHQLLVKMFPKNRKLVHAAVLMTSKSSDLKRSKNKSYGWLRKLHSEVLMGHEVSEESRKKISKARIGMSYGPHSEETKRKISESNKGKTISQECKDAVAEANRKRVFTEEIRKKMSETRKGKVFTEEHRRNISEGQKGRKATPEQIARCYIMSENNKGLKRSEAVKARQSETMKNRVLTPEAKANISAAVSESNRRRVVTPEMTAKRLATAERNRKARFEIGEVIEWSAK